MTTPTPSEPTPTPDSGDAIQRAEPRLGTDKLHCCAGRVVDMTGSGMRLLVPWKEAPRVDEPQTYTFGEGDDAVSVMGTVRWVRPAGRLHKRAEVGVEFVGISTAKKDAMRRFAVTGDPAMLRKADDDGVRVQLPDLYRMLGVSVYASDQDIRKAYHALAKETHPDRDEAEDASSRFAELNKAYSILRDKDLRAKYDERLAEMQRKAA